MQPPTSPFSHDEVRMTDLLPPGPAADFFMRLAALAVGDRNADLENLIAIMGIGGCEAEARAAFDLAMPLGQEDRLDTNDGQVSLMERVWAIMLASEMPPPSLELH